MNIVGVYHFLVYMQTAQNTAVCIYTTPGALHAPGVVYIESVVVNISLHIHQEMVYTCHFLIIFLGLNLALCIFVGSPTVDI